MKVDYESLSYKLKFKRALKIALIVLIICIVVLAPTLWFWDQSIQQRQTLREAKNVVMNTDLLSMELYALSDGVVDKGRLSGMTAEAEEKIISYSGAEGEIHLISWNTKKNCVTTMNYQKGRFLVQYRYDESKDLQVWDVFWNIRQYDN